MRLAWACAALLSLATPAVAADDALIEAARREREMPWYTTQLVPLAEGLAAAFGKAYGVTVRPARYSPGDMALRIVNEGKAGRMQSDVFDGSETVSIVRKNDFVERYTPASAARLPSQFVDPNGFWVATNLFVLSPAYNTNLMPPGTEPRTLEDLLAPRFRNAMVISSNPGIAGIPGLIEIALREFGETRGLDYVQRLSQQQLIPVPNSPATLARVVSGENALGLQFFVNQIAAAAATGAPIRRIPMSPALAVYSVASLTKGAVHPNAGKLFIDFIASAEGQAIYRQFGYITVDPQAPPLDPTLRPDGVTQRALYISPDDIADLLPRLLDLQAKFFR